jgi:hypothetical protein
MNYCRIERQKAALAVTQGVDEPLPVRVQSTAPFIVPTISDGIAVIKMRNKTKHRNRPASSEWVELASGEAWEGFCPGTLVCPSKELHISNDCEISYPILSYNMNKVIEDYILQ